MDSVNSQSSYPEGDARHDTSLVGRPPATRATALTPAIAGRQLLLEAAQVVEHEGATLADGPRASADLRRLGPQTDSSTGGGHAAARDGASGPPRAAFRPVLGARAALPAAGIERRAKVTRDGFDTTSTNAPVAVAPARQRAPADLVADQVIYGHRVQRGDSLRTLLIDESLIQFTPTEYRLLITILERGGLPVPYARLTDAALGRDPDRDTRRLLDKHVDHIRSKLRMIGLTVGCIARYGYVLIPDELIEV